MENGLSASDVALLNGREADGFGGNGFFWVFALLILLFGGNGFGFGGAGAMNAVSQADLQRAIDLNSIQNGQRDIAADVQRTTYESMAVTKDAAYNNLSEIRDVQSAISVGNANIINNLTGLQATMQTCCCGLDKTLMENRYLAAQNTAEINAVTTAQTQKILDAISGNRIADMQNQINALQLQNAVAGVVRYPMSTAYCSGTNPFCGCNCGCGNA